MVLEVPGMVFRASEHDFGGPRVGLEVPGLLFAQEAHKTAQHIHRS